MRRVMVHDYRWLDTIYSISKGIHIYALIQWGINAAAAELTKAYAWDPKTGDDSDFVG